MPVLVSSPSLRQPSRISTTHDDACGPQCVGLCKAVLEASGVATYGSYSTIQRCEVTCGAPPTLTADFVSAVCGRRPQGTIAPRMGHGDRRNLATYLCEAAELEAASVPAFAQLKADLVRHGAPNVLVQAARLAMSDEARHWRRTRDLARRHGAQPVRQSPAQVPTQALEEMAIQNIVEGCVRETFGAMVATYQASLADDSDVRRLMQEIAVDELHHAALSWRIDAWAMSLLGTGFAERRRAAAGAAVRELLAAVRLTPDGDFLEAAGLPGQVRSQALLATACVQVWGPQFA